MSLNGQLNFKDLTHLLSTQTHPFDTLRFNVQFHLRKKHTDIYLTINNISWRVNAFLQLKCTREKERLTWLNRHAWSRWGIEGLINLFHNFLICGSLPSSPILSINPSPQPLPLSPFPLSLSLCINRDMLSPKTRLIELFLKVGLHAFLL